MVVLIEQFYRHRLFLPWSTAFMSLTLGSSMMGHYIKTFQSLLQFEERWSCHFLLYPTLHISSWHDDINKSDVCGCVYVLCGNLKAWSSYCYSSPKNGRASSAQVDSTGEDGTHVLFKHWTSEPTSHEIGQCLTLAADHDIELLYVLLFFLGGGRGEQCWQGVRCKKICYLSIKEIRFGRAVILKWILLQLEIYWSLWLKIDPKNGWLKQKTWHNLWSSLQNRFWAVANISYDL